MKCQVDAIQWRGGGSTMNVPLMGPFYIFRLSQRGARAPPAPPESATVDVLARGIKDLSPLCMLYADDIVLCGTRREVVEKKLE